MVIQLPQYKRGELMILSSDDTVGVWTIVK